LTITAISFKIFRSNENQNLYFVTGAGRNGNLCTKLSVSGYPAPGG
jgi:hypothetical protein